MALTHDELVTIGCRWLKRSYRSSLGFKSSCGVVVPEMVTSERECPDVVGWSARRRPGQYPACYMIECKTSRADFLSDQKKRHRADGSVGMRRWYLCPTGVIQREELPHGWGLLWTDGKSIRVKQWAPVNGQRNLSAEMSIMYSLLRRSELRDDLRKCFSAKWGGEPLTRD